VSKNPHQVSKGQVWIDNDPRQTFGKRTFEVIEVEEDYGPHGRARCKIKDPHPNQREYFYAKLSRFNGTKRGYSRVESSC